MLAATFAGELIRFNGYVWYIRTSGGCICFVRASL
jgi:hypothetical protein